MIRRKLAMLKESVSMSVSNIMGNRMRSFLTILGVIIGVTAIIALITIVSGATAEVTEQFEAVSEFLTALKGAGIHTCIETNAMHPRLPELAKPVDHLIMDIKHPDDTAHRAMIGASNRTVLANLDALKNRQLAVRIPLIGGFNDSCAAAFAELLKGRSITVEVLRYHEYGKDKYAALGIPYPMTEAAYISDETYRAFTQTLRNAGIRVVHT